MNNQQARKTSILGDDVSLDDLEQILDDYRAAFGDENEEEERYTPVGIGMGDGGPSPGYRRMSDISEEESLRETLRGMPPPERWF